MIANPATSTTLDIPVGFWGAELTHAWFAFTEAGYEVTIASPDGGKCELDAWSDPRDAKVLVWRSDHDGLLHTPEYMRLLDDTPASASSTTTTSTRSSVTGGE